MLQHTTTTTRRAVSAFTAALLGCALLGFGAPAAFAEYNIAAPSKDYTAVDKVAVTGSPISASRIPNGTYRITASTSSSMASMSDVTLTVRDGSMSVNFTLTPSYTAIYPGKPEEAASLSNDDGTEVSPSYVMGKLNADGETRNFTMSISSLNAVLVYSAYNGNSKRNSGMWYGRSVCFNSSAEIDALVATSAGDDEPGKDEPGVDDPGKDNPGTDDPGTDEPGKDEPGKDDPGADKPTNGAGSGKADGGKPGGSGNGSASNAAGKGQGAGSGQSPKTDSAQVPEADADESDSPKADRTDRTFATLGGPFAAIAYAEDASAGDASAKEADALEGTPIDYQRLLCVLIAALVAAGFSVRILIYGRQRK